MHGLCSAEGERIIEQALASQEIFCDLIKIPGALRMRFTLYDRKESKVTRCTQQGTAVDSKAMEQLEVAFARNLLEMGEGDVVVLGGILRRRWTLQFTQGWRAWRRIEKYARFWQRITSFWKRGSLRGPYAAIASLRDLERLAGKRMNANKRICAEAQKILQKWGTKYLCIDAGERMLMVSREGAFWRNAKNKRDWQRPGRRHCGIGAWSADDGGGRTVASLCGCGQRSAMRRGSDGARGI